MKDAKSLDWKGFMVVAAAQRNFFRMNRTLSNAVEGMFGMRAGWAENHMNEGMELGTLVYISWKHCIILISLVKYMGK